MENNKNEVATPLGPFIINGTTPGHGGSIVVALLSFLLPLLLASTIIFKLIDLHKREAVFEMQYWAQAFITKLQGRLEANIAIGRGFDAHISVLGSMSQAELEELAPRLLEPELSIRHIGIAPDLKISAVYPVAGNEPALGLNYRTHLEQRDEAVKALRLNRIVLAGPLTLVQGEENQLVARFPVYNPDGSEWGLVALVIDANDLLKSAGVNMLSKKYEVAIRKVDASNSRTFFGRAELFENAEQLHPIAVHGGEWQMAIRSNDSVVPVRIYLLYWIVALSVCLSIALVVYSYRKTSMNRQAQLQYLESILAIDPLTRLTSRYKFNENLTDLIGRSHASGEHFTLLLIDLDHFKDINDSLGHHAGDQLLVEVAGRLKKCIHPGDLLCRFGGDEFMIVFMGEWKTIDIERRAEHITAVIGEKVTVSGKVIGITASVGAAVFPDDGQDAETLIQHADLAMFESKRAGRNTLYFFNVKQRNEADRYIKLHTEIKAAMNSEQFQVYYQPIYDVQAENFTRCEALCRWHRPDGEIISPDEFVPVAEQSGLIADLGLWLTEQAFQFYGELKQEGVEMNISLNRSPQEFGSTFHTNQLISLAERFGIPARQITLEITESLFMSDHGIKIKNFHVLKKAGFNFSIDDFGTGYSALSYLRQFPVESLKVDKSYIVELGDTQQADTLVKVIIQMAKTLGIAVVAEGVETREQMLFLKNIGCEYIQGFYFAKPMPRDEFLAFIVEARKRKWLL